MPGMPSPELDFPTALGALVKVYGQAQLAVARPELLAYNGCYRPRIMNRLKRDKPGGTEELGGLIGKIGVRWTSFSTNPVPLPAYHRTLVKSVTCLGGGTGRRKGLKIPRSQGRAGSSPAPGTSLFLGNIKLVRGGLAPPLGYCVFRLCLSRLPFPWAPPSGSHAGRVAASGPFHKVKSFNRAG
jgi:hypothetical protein